MIKNDCSAWANVRGTGFDQNNAISTYEEQINVTGDIGRKLSSDLRVALLAAYAASKKHYALKHHWCKEFK
jgi:hypothetical protein